MPDLDDDSNYETILDRFGKPVRILRDGKVARTSLMLRDGLSDVQRAIAADRRRVVDGAGGTGLSRPGVRRPADDSLFDAAREAFEQASIAQSNAWRRGPQQQDERPPIGAQGPYEERLVGSPCTTNGQRGTLQRQGNYLICRPSERTDSAPPSMDAATAEAIKTKAYDEMVKDGEAAWKRLGASA
jgi:hypothetical protein